MSFAAMFANIAILSSIVVILVAAFIQMSNKKWGGDDKTVDAKEPTYDIDWWIVPRYTQSSAARALGPTCC